jgi:hypothetical protein
MVHVACAAPFRAFDWIICKLGKAFKQISFGQGALVY